MHRIAIIGPESVGKSTLAQQLGQRLAIPIVNEYAREYVEHLNRPYTYDDVEIIARHQTQEFEQYKNAVFDTEMIITKVWFDIVYGKRPEWLDNWMETHKMNFYILLQPTIPWQYDPVRENPGNRDTLYQIYKSEIIRLGVPFTECDPTQINAETLITNLRKL